MRVLITGANGFLGKNLLVFLRERRDLQVAGLGRDATTADWQREVGQADFIFHLAGTNRPKDPAEFTVGNPGLMAELCALVAASGRRAPIMFSSSSSAAQDTPYGRSKREAEDVLRTHGERTGTPVHIYRLPNLFGKWGKPNYNSVVTTFCYNIPRDLPIRVDDPSAQVTLAYVDDVVASLAKLLESPTAPGGFHDVAPLYTVSVGEIAASLRAFKESRNTLQTERVGTGFLHALYATYVSYLPKEQFGYSVPCYTDPRGSFAEMLKTPDCGQFSFFTAHPGITRGGHYHHSKTEKFLVIQGSARYRFRHMISGETHDVLASGAKPEIIETVPGWTHDITNIGTDEMLVMLWANEVFDRQRPDTYVCPV